MDFNFLVQIIESAVNVISLGVYNDISSLLVDVPPSTTASLVAWIFSIFKWSWAFFAIFLICTFITSKLNLDFGFSWWIAPLVLSVIILIIIFAVYNNPVNDAQTISSRLTSFSNAMVDKPVNYTPSLVLPFINLTRLPIDYMGAAMIGVQNAIPDNFTAIGLENSGGMLPAVKEESYNITWLKWIVYVILLVVAILLVRFFIPLAGIILALLVILMAMGINYDTIATIIVIILSGIILYQLLFNSNLEKISFFATIPVSVIIVCILYLLQLPQNILIVMLIAALIMLLYPWFYMLGLVLFAFGEMRESRSKFGMKRKPLRVIEETAATWDPRMVAVILTLLFTGIIVLFSLSVTGLGVFTTTILMLFTR